MSQIAHLITEDFPSISGFVFISVRHRTGPLLWGASTMALILCTETVETAKEQGTKFSELLSELSLSMNTLKKQTF